jgi:hypothetical protein
MEIKRSRKHGWPMMQCWHRGLWRSWDQLTPRQRKVYEEQNEVTQTERRLLVISRALARVSGEHQIARHSGRALQKIRGLGLEPD